MLYNNIEYLLKYIYFMQCGNLHNLQIALYNQTIPSLAVQWSSVVDLNYYTELANYNISSSDQLVIACIHAGRSSSKLYS